MLSVKNITKEYDDKTVLKNIDLAVNDTDRIGLIGNNGEGKSTLFKIITGEIKPDSGSIDLMNIVLGYIPQHQDFEDLTIKEFLNIYVNKDESYITEQVLNELNLEYLDETIKCQALSGGQKTKLYIASLLLKNPQPTLLLLDEPTNNLDITSLDWLENYIKTFDGGVLLTSHDRYFLDKVCNKIFELKNGVIKVYGGNYSFYRKQKDVEEQAYERMYTTQQKQIHKIEENIQGLKYTAQKYENIFSSRNPYQKKKAGKTAKTAVIREEKLEKLLNSTEYLEKPKHIKKYGVDLLGLNPQGKLMLSVKNLSFSYDNHELFTNITFDLFGSERVWVMGKNGSGKTTLLKIVTGALIPKQGIIKLGTNIKYGYFSQDATNLDDNITGITELLSVNRDSTECFRLAVHLHLTQEDLLKKIKQLSSGQKIKLEFAKLLLAENSLLIMDEPTNHLEIETREEIEGALQEYKGAILVVSHDRYFVEKLSINNVVELG